MHCSVFWLCMQLEASQEKKLKNQKAKRCRCRISVHARASVLKSDASGKNGMSLCCDAFLELL